MIQIYQYAAMRQLFPTLAKFIRCLHYFPMDGGGLDVEQNMCVDRDGQRCCKRGVDLIQTVP
jgi:hypothetical protein